MSKSLHIQLIIVLIFSLFISGCITDESDKISGVRLIDDGTAEENYQSSLTQKDVNDVNEVADENNIPDAENENRIEEQKITQQYVLTKTKFGNEFYYGQVGECKSSFGEFRGGVFLKSVSDSEYTRETTGYSCYENEIFAFSIILPRHLSEVEFIKYYIDDTLIDGSDIHMTTEVDGQQFLDFTGLVIPFDGERAEQQTQYIWHDEGYVYIFALKQNYIQTLTADQVAEIEDTLVLYEMYKDINPSTMIEGLSYFD